MRKRKSRTKSLGWYCRRASPCPSTSAPARFIDHRVAQASNKAVNSRKRVEAFGVKIAVLIVVVGIVVGFINLFTSSVAKEAGSTRGTNVSRKGVGMRTEHPKFARTGKSARV